MSGGHVGLATVFQNIGFRGWACSLLPAHSILNIDLGALYESQAMNWVFRCGRRLGLPGQLDSNVPGWGANPADWA
jgi:hypothetical protein